MSRLGERTSGFFGSLSGGSAISGNPVGSFFDVDIQNATLPNTEYAMKFSNYDTNATTSGLCFITLDALNRPTRINVAQTGVYNLQFSAQYRRLSGGSIETIDIWLRKNGIDYEDNTNTHVSVQANQTYIVPAWNFFIKLNSGQFVEIMWATTSTAIQLYSELATALHPLTPSVIATINRVS